MQAEQISQIAQRLGGFVRGKAFKFVIGGSLIVLGVLMLIGSFVFDWVEDDTGSQHMPASAMTIWLGGNDDVQTLDIAKMIDASNPFNEDAKDIGGFGDVRLLDRFLILLPIGALTLIGLAVVYLFFMNNLPWLTPLRALVGMAAISCFLLLFPLVWESLSVNNWENADLGEFGSSSGVGVAASQIFSTIEQQSLGFIAFLIATTGLVLYMLNEQGALGGVPGGSPSSRQQQAQRPPQARPAPPRKPGQAEPSIPSPQPPKPPGQSS